MKTKTSILTAISAAAGVVALDRWRRRAWLDLRGKVVLITGGSRGLGLAMAKEFASHGAVVAICARDEAELDRARTILSARGSEAHTFVCDVADRNLVAATIAAVTGRLGPIDVLVNNAGAIKVGPFFAMDLQDFEQAMSVMFWGSLYATLAVLPMMRLRKKGSILNITSIGGKVSVPHLLPYCCAKFATVALSEGLRAELAPAGIRVTTIVPGLLRTGSHLNAEFKGQPRDEYTWFAAGAATPFISIGAERAARSIVQAAIRGTGQRILSLPADALVRLHGAAPGLAGHLLSLANRMLPAEQAGSSAAIPGREIESSLNSRVWRTMTALGQKAAEELNEIAVDWKL